ncbi:MAG TPA: glycoside hydrolase family 16 protein [Polyangiaceae bacterium]
MPTRRLLIRAAATALASLPGRSFAGPSPGSNPAQAPWSDAASGYKLVKNWDFVTSIRDIKALQGEFHTRYIYGNGSTDHLNDEWTRYRDHRNHVFTPQGLSLVARLVGELTPGNIESGMLRSRWTAQYGVFEIRMKVPAALGMLSAFWLNPEDQHWPPEIDVVEVVNHSDGGSQQSYHFVHGIGVQKEPIQSKLNRKHAYAPGFDYSGAFHTFAVEWQRDSLRHYVDGVQVIERKFQWVHGDGSDAGPAHLLVNLAVGGKWPGPPASVASFPASLLISQIRVWQR